MEVLQKKTTKKRVWRIVSVVIDKQDVYEVERLVEKRVIKVSSWPHIESVEPSTYYSSLFHDVLYFRVSFIFLFCGRTIQKRMHYGRHCLKLQRLQLGQRMTLLNHHNSCVVTDTGCSITLNLQTELYLML